MYQSQVYEQEKFVIEFFTNIQTRLLSFRNFFSKLNKIVLRFNKLNMTVQFQFENKMFIQENEIFEILNEESMFQV